MGEYATYNGQRIKIGTCEDMYYLRADQRDKVEPETHSVDPSDEDVLRTLRFRFPFPDEDGVQPGEFDPYERFHPVASVAVPQEVEHYSVQFSAQPGYLLSLPCPESDETPEGLRIARNGIVGPMVAITQTAWRNGAWAVICACRGCGAKFNLPTLKDALPLLEALMVGTAFDKEIALRIEAGYRQPVTA